VKTLIRLLARLVERAAVPVVILTLLATAGLGVLSGRTVTSTGQEGFSPDSPEIAASRRIGELFGEESVASVMQVIVRSEGGDVVGPEGWAVVSRILPALEAAGLGDVIGAPNPGQPPVVTFLDPVGFAALQADIDPSGLDAAAFDALYADALAAAGPEAGFVTQLLPAGAGTASDVGLALVFVASTADLDAQVAREAAVARVIEGLSTEAIELRPFSFALLFDGDTFDFQAELGRLFGSAFAIIVGLLLFVYWLRTGGNATRGRAARRTLADMGLTMLTIVLAIVWTQGLTAALQIVGVVGDLTEVAQIVPILLIGLGVDYGIHLTSRYRDEVGAGADVSAGIGRAIGTVGVALVLATVTTVIGFLANVFNPIPALVDFGIMAAVGILVSFVLMLTFVPAVRLLLDRRAERRGTLPTDGMGATSSRLLPQLMGRTAVLAERVPVLTLAVMLALGGAGWVGFTNLDTRFSFTDFLPPDAPQVVTLAILEERFSGGFAETTQVLVEGDALATPAGLNALADAVTAMAGTADVVTVTTPRGPVAQVRSPLGLVQARFTPGPDGAPLDPAAAGALVAAGYDPATGRFAPDADLEAIWAVVDDGTLGTVLVRDGEGPAALLEITTQARDDRALALRDALLEDLAPTVDAGLVVAVTSQNIISTSITEGLVDSQLSSLLVTLLLATLVLMVSFGIENRRPFLGVLTILPVALVVLWTFGGMYLAGIPFGPVTATLTGLAIGIGVPYTIHMARRFEEDRLRFDDIADAIRETTTRTGGALAGSALTTAAGFGILVTSSLTPFRQLGQVVSLAILLSLLGAVLVLPSLLVLWERWHRRRGDAGTVRATRSLVGNGRDAVGATPPGGAAARADGAAATRARPDAGLLRRVLPMAAGAVVLRAAIAAVRRG
jgi:predicted RND superfamily exporter protein